MLFCFDFVTPKAALSLCQSNYFVIGWCGAVSTNRKVFTCFSDFFFFCLHLQFSVTPHKITFFSALHQTSTKHVNVKVKACCLFSIVPLVLLDLNTIQKLVTPELSTQVKPRLSEAASYCYVSKHRWRDFGCTNPRGLRLQRKRSLWPIQQLISSFGFCLHFLAAVILSNLLRTLGDKKSVKVQSY